MEKDDFLKSGHGREESHEEMRELDSSHNDSHKDYNHIIRFKISFIICMPENNLFIYINNNNNHER
ncbi:unnamed protein product [Arabis nemorensis]|uniref:Uncharacterized protein n=1 Tax=Arabis nemorensis TaxID=586526 RepID=A0A565AQX4_9BRAS|nr:unnamed protein product [Arabis nemorensis]